MTYQETVDWMFDQLPMYQQKGAVAYHDKLDNIKAFADVLGNPETKFKSIHVAGTNGKGSSSHMLASVLQEAGYKVGLYTSPHLKDFRERIKINGKKVGKAYVQGFIETHFEFLAYKKLSFFEMTVGMAFGYFADEKVDIAIVEVGMGGRLDSTNIILPEVSLITNIGLDHTQFLGNTLEKIAMEKAGIIKRGVPVVVSEKQLETKGVFRLMAAQKRAKLVFAQENIDKIYKTDLLGNYQKKNVRGVMATLHQLKDFEIQKNHIEHGLKNVVANTGLLGRWQVMGTKPLVVSDTAHNKEGLQLVMEQVGQQKFKQLHMVLGFVNDKNLGEVLALLPKKAKYYFVKPNIPRGMDASKLRDEALVFGLQGGVFNSVKKGMKQAIDKAAKGDFVYVGGSTFVVAEVV